MNKFYNKFKKYNLPNLGWTRLPKPPITKEDRIKYNCLETDSNYKLLSNICNIGYNEKLKKGLIPKNKEKEYLDRIKLELDTFEELYFTDYILLVWKIIDKAKEMGVFIDWGRGSVVSSIVSWLTGMTGCDPIKAKLFFSRFISKARAKSKIVDGEVWISNDLCPDIDCNLADKVGDIVKWLESIYPNRICKIATVSSLTGKVLVKDVYKTFNEASEEKAKDIADLIERHFGVVQDIEQVYKENKDFKKWANEFKETYNICLNLRNNIRGISSHASGYLISFDDLSEHTPLILDTERNPMSAYLMDDIQCLKVDFLGLDTNTLVKNILELIPEKIEDVNLEDNPIIYDQYQNNNLLPYGLYQINSSCAYRVCSNLKPKNVMEMSHVSAISRPVALPYEKVYLDKETKCPHPIFEEALRWTNYAPLYQEQTLMCLKAIGFSDEEAEQARRVYAKKKLGETEQQLKKVKEKLEQNKLPKEVGDIVIKLAQDGASYQFNLSHSLAVSYLTAATTYLKYKYPLQFYLCCLNMAKDTGNSKMSPVEKVSAIKDELKHFGIELLPPHILKSGIDFTIDGNNIRYGLGTIKSISFKNFEKLRNFCHSYSDKFSIFSAAGECGLNIAIVSNIIAVGAMDEYLTNNSRAHTILELQLFNLLTPREQQRVIELGKDFNYNLIDIIKHLSKPLEGSIKPFIKESRLQTLRKHFEPYNRIYKQNSQNEELCNYFFERTLLGFSYSHKLFDILKKTYTDIMPLNECIGELDKTKVVVGGEIVEYKAGTSKNKNKYIKIKISDGTASFNAMIMEKHFNSNNELNNNKSIKEGDIVMVEGEKMNDIIFACKIVNQNAKILSKTSELKKENN